MNSMVCVHYIIRLSYSLLLCEGVTSLDEVPFDFLLSLSETPFQLRDIVDEFS